MNAEKIKIIINHTNFPLLILIAARKCIFFHLMGLIIFYLCWRECDFWLAFSAKDKEEASVFDGEVLAGMGVWEQSAAGWICQAGRQIAFHTGWLHTPVPAVSAHYIYKRRVRFPLSTPESERGCAARRVTSRRRCAFSAPKMRSGRIARGGLAAPPPPTARK